MAIYVVTGGTSGIGQSAVELLRSQGHEVCAIGTRKGDLICNLEDKEARKRAIAELHERYPDGIDGLICNAGVAAVNCPDPAKMLSINYFGAREFAEGCFDLLKMRKGACVLTLTASLTFYHVGAYDLHHLMEQGCSEERIRRLADSFPDKFAAANQMYVATKYALYRWMRTTAPEWGLHGVNLNGVAPGSAATRLTSDMPKEAFDRFVMGTPMCMYYKEETMQNADDLANAMAFLVSPGVHGVCGQLLVCDGGADTLLRASDALI